MLAKITNKDSQYYGRTGKIVDKQTSVEGNRIYLIEIHAYKVESFYEHEVQIQ